MRTPRPDPRALADVAAVVLGALVAGLALGAAGVPSATLFGGLVAGLARALLHPRRLDLPRPAMTTAQAVLGVSLGALVDPQTLRAVGEHWLPVVLVTVGSLLLSLAAGRLMALHRGVSRVTGAFAMIAGGASGVTAMADDLGADARMVAVLQYLRVLLVVLAMPVVAATVSDAPDGGAGAAAGTAGGPAGLLLTASCALAGTLLGRLVRLPVAALLGPLVLTAALDLGGAAGAVGVPGWLEAAAFLVIGLQVGVSFTRASLATVGRAPPALGLIIALGVACAGLGAALSATAGVSPVTGYLATTPGGLYAVLAAATDTGADATFVLAVQVLRLFVMLLAAPLLARALRRRPG